MKNAWPKVWIAVLFWMVTTHAIQAADYLSFDDAMRLAFPHSGKVERFKPVITAEQQRLILDKSASKSQASLGGIYVGHSNGVVDGIAIVDHVIGRTEYITWLCILTPHGAVQRMEVMTYREPYGSEIRDRRFLDQFNHKDASSPVRVDREIGNIGGATLSVNALTDRVRFILQLSALVVQPALPEWLKGRESPAIAAPTLTETTRALPVGNSPLTIRILPASTTAQTMADRGLQSAQKLDLALNAWRKEAELAQLNNARQAVVSDDLLSALLLARRAYDFSGGLFDPTIYPLLQVWKKAADTGTPPTAVELQAAQKLIGFARVTVDAPTKTVTLPTGMALDLSGLNKGLIIDHAAQSLALTNNLSALLSHGGSSWLALGKAHAELHAIAIRHPTDPTQITHTILLKPGQGFGSAASNGRTFVVGDSTHSHLINPLTGQPAALNRAASVIADSAALADMLDTALCLMPIDEGLALVESLPGVAALLWDGEHFHRSARWP